MARKKAASLEAKCKPRLEEQADEAIRDEIEHEGEAKHPPTVTGAVARGLSRARRAGERLGADEEEVAEVTLHQARRVLADELPDRGRRSAKKSQATTQILRAAEHRPFPQGTSARDQEGDRGRRT